MRPWIMWAFTALFFAYQFIIRVFPGLCVSELMQKFQIDATEFGLLSSMYYYGYAGVQIPLALLLDRFGPRLIVSLCCCLCSVSVLLFYWATDWYVVLFARFFMGVGSAAGFLGTFKVISLCFPLPTYARMFALTNTVGLLGAVYAGKPLGSLISFYGWEKVFLMLGIVGLIFAGLIFLIIKPYKLSSFQETPSFCKNFQSLFSMPILFLIALGNLLMVGPLEGFADVWGIPYLMEIYPFTKTDASFITSSIFTGMIIGGPILAYFSEKFKASFQITALCGISMAILFAIMLLSEGTLSYMALFIMMLVVGILCCYQVLIFSMSASIVPSEMRNVTIAFLNCINMAGGIFFHTLIGVLMDIFWTGGISEGQRIYDATSYKYAIGIIPVAALTGGILFLSLKRLEKNGAVQLIPLLQKS